MFKFTTSVILISLFVSCSTEIAQNKTELTWSKNIKDNLHYIERKAKRVIDWLSDEFHKNSEENEKQLTTITQGRTFGTLRRLKIAIPAIMYKMGAMSTLLGVLTLIALKGLIVGVILLVLQLSTVLAKLQIAKKDEEHKKPQNIHIHVHESSGGHGHYYSHSGPGPYSGWSKSAPISNSDEGYYYNKWKELLSRDNLYAQEDI